MMPFVCKYPRPSQTSYIYKISAKLDYRDLEIQVDETCQSDSVAGQIVLDEVLDRTMFHPRRYQREHEKMF